MLKVIVILLLFFCLFGTCSYLLWSNSKQTQVSTQQTIQLLKVAENDEDSGGKSATEKHAVLFKGRFVTLRKINARDYSLVLRDSMDRLDSFYTVMPIDSNEIRLLAKKGNYIVLYYSLFHNPIPNTPAKFVRSMVPVYK